jgi:IS6 family transposase
LKTAETVPASCELRQSKYLNNLVEQDHRFIKWLTKPGMGFVSFETAWRTLQGYEMMNMIRKGQEGAKGEVEGQVALVAKLFGRAASTEQGEPFQAHLVFFLFSCNTTDTSTLP